MIAPKREVEQTNINLVWAKKSSIMSTITNAVLLLLLFTRSVAWISSSSRRHRSRNNVFLANERPSSFRSTASPSPLLLASTELFSSAHHDDDDHQRCTVQGIVATGISKEERSVLFPYISQQLQLAEEIIVDQLGAAVGFRWDDCRSVPANAVVLATEEEEATTMPPGALGRVLILTTTSSAEEEETEYLQALISQTIDELVWNNYHNQDSSSSDGLAIVKQPILVWMMSEEEQDHLLPTFDEDPDKAVVTAVRAFIQNQVEQYELTKPIFSSSPSTTEEKSNPLFCVPAERIELDGAVVRDPFTGEEHWDTSSVLVFDHLVSDDLRHRLLRVVLGNDDAANDDDGLDPDRWVRGSLSDLPDEEDDDDDDDDDNDDNDDDADASSSTVVGGGCYGLTEEGINDLCFRRHGALEEFEGILAELFPGCVLSRMPEAVQGSGVSPLTANAPVAGDEFSYHIDGDPALAPPSPWTDVFGRYPNRCSGKPRMVSCLVYLNADPRYYEKHGAPTRLLDVATDTTYDVEVKPGRVVLMDQDITHTVVAPTKATTNATTGPPPRYSLVWKLILHPKETNQDMTRLLDRHHHHRSSPPWPEPVYLGSAAAGAPPANKNGHHHNQT